MSSLGRVFVKGLFGLLVLIALAVSTDLSAFMPPDTMMYGNLIVPLEDVNVRLCDVRIVIHGLGGRATADFLLESLEKEKIAFRVAFPDTADCEKCLQDPEFFQVWVNDEPVRRAQISQTETSFGKEIRSFSWTVSLEPGEKKTIRCGFPFGGYTNPKDQDFFWYFQYAKLWKGDLGLIQVKYSLPKDLIDLVKAKDPIACPSIRINPKTYAIEGNVLQWSFAGETIPEFVGLSLDYSGPVIRPDSETRFPGKIVLDRDGQIFKIVGSPRLAETQLTSLDVKHHSANSEPRWSPDGRRIAFVNGRYVRERRSDRDNIYLMDEDGGNKKKITSFDCGSVFDLTWSACGRYIHFNYNPHRCGTMRVDRYAVDIETGTITECPEDISAYRTFKDELWSEDGSRGAVQENGTIRILDRQNTLVCATDDPCESPCGTWACGPFYKWSRKADQLLYCCRCGAEGTPGLLYILDVRSRRSSFIGYGQNADWHLE